MESIDLNGCNVDAPQFNCDVTITRAFDIIYSQTIQLYRSLENIEDTIINLPAFNWSSVLNNEISYSFLDSIKCQINELINSSNKLSERYTRMYKVHDFIFFNLLEEAKLLSADKKYFYESILNILHPVTLGPKFYVNFVYLLNWQHLTIQTILQLNSEEVVTFIYLLRNSLLDNAKLNLNNISFILSIIIACLMHYKKNVSIEDMFNELSEEYLEKIETEQFEVFDKINAFLLIFRTFLREFISFHLAQIPDDNFICELSEKKNSLVFFDESIKKALNFIHKISFFLPLKLSSEDLHNFIKNHTIKYPLLKEVIDILSLWKYLVRNFNYEDNLLIIPDRAGFVTEFHKLEQFNIEDNLFTKRFIDEKRTGFQLILLCLVNNIEVKEIESLFNKLNVDFDKKLFNFIAKRIQTCKQDEKKYVTEFLKRKLISFVNLDNAQKYMREHFAVFDLTPICSINESELRYTLNRVSTKNPNTLLLAKKEIIINTFLDPLTTLNCILNESICQNQSLIPLVASIFTTYLAPLCSSLVDVTTGKTLLIAMLDHKMRNSESSEDIRGVVDLIKRVFFYYHYSNLSDDEPLVITLEHLLVSMVENGVFANEIVVCNKVLVLKLISSLSIIENKPWKILEEEPAPILYQMLQLIEYFWFDGQKKADVLLLLNHLISNKIKRKLSFQELNWIADKMKENENELTLLAYFESAIDMDIKDIFDLSNGCTNEFLLLACIGKNMNWIYEKLDAHYLYSAPDLSVVISSVLRFLTRQEWINLTHFLHKYWSYTKIIKEYVDGLLNPDEEIKLVNRSYLIFCLVSTIKDIILKKQLDLNDDVDYFVIYQVLAKILCTKDYNKREKQNIRTLLFEIVTVIKDNYNIDSVRCLCLTPNLHPTALEILENLVDHWERSINEPMAIKFSPI